MRNILQTNTKYLISAIALTTGILGICSLQINAQTNTSESDFLRDIQVGKDIEWTFPSENESISVKDDIRELGDYSISESDPELIDEEQEWGNTGDVKDHSVEFEIYDY